MNQHINDWENPAVQGINKEPPHVTLLPFADKSAALKGEREKTPFFQLLNGDWKFQFAPTPAQAPEGFFVERYDNCGLGRPACALELADPRLRPPPLPGLQLCL